VLAFSGQVLAHERSVGVGRRLGHGRVRIQGNGPGGWVCQSSSSRL
jgi:hypothetical protein